MEKIEFDLVIDGARLRFVRTDIYKDRPVIVFLHESFGCIKHWKDFPFMLGELAKNDVLIYDRQGYGESDPFTITKRNNNYLEIEADILSKILIELNIREAILFGHSDGGSIALITAAKYPQLIKAVITEGAHVFVEDITLNGVKETVKIYENSDLRSKLSKYHEDKTDMVFRMWYETWLSEEYRNWNMENFLPDIVCPVLVIQGKNDEYGSIEQVNSIFEKVSGKSWRFIPEGGHTPHRETKELVLEEVSGFINSLK